MKVLGDFRSNLSRIAIDCLTAGDDEIIVEVAESACDGYGSSPGICAAESAVSNKDTLVGAHSHSLAENFICLRKTHGENRNLCTVLVLQLKSSLKACLVIRVHDCEHCCSVKSTIGVKYDTALCIRYLLYTNNDFHC